MNLDLRVHWFIIVTHIIGAQRSGMLPCYRHTSLYLRNDKTVQELQRCINHLPTGVWRKIAALR